MLRMIIIQSCENDVTSRFEFCQRQLPLFIASTYMLDVANWSNWFHLYSASCTALAVVKPASKLGGGGEQRGGEKKKIRVEKNVHKTCNNVPFYAKIVKFELILILLELFLGGKLEGGGNFGEANAPIRQVLCGMYRENVQ